MPSYIFGRNAITEALLSGKKIEKIFCQYGIDASALASLKKHAKQAHVPLALMEKRKFQALERSICRRYGYAQGVIALVQELPILTVHELIEYSFTIADNPLLVALDNITDPQNLGAIARSAECAGFAGILLPETKSAPLSGAAIKASAGALHHIRVARTSSLRTALEDCKNAGFQVIGLDAHATHEYSKQLQTDKLAYEPIVLVIGSEGVGIHPSIRRICTHTLAIPLCGNVPSLNASVAAGIVMFEIVRQRQSSSHL
ncbi:MAG: 23S rRNA (guanosine(2251)-2'-O)-methyltransferase RlmB [Bacteroidota bacterium]|nr:23S rRNA (guanosine(2251)-2'-O)-methyltransferase RlmB [Candidatus Kapabacteria bacterium]MDW8220356.1 23S rRNA (guanosine(2251)-2'-O)-methyltransferase RlmB [Bacteroidota bacterium]